jgi:photosystem II stability/assembly factor-like uncharacterized protein
MQHPFLPKILFLAILLASGAAFAQKKAKPAVAVRPAPTPAAERMAGYQRRLNLQQHSIAAQVPFRNVGPTIMSGRVTDLDVCPDDPSVFLVAYASGGLWLTKSNGTSFVPLLDHQPTMTIGAVAATWRGTSPATIWVGSGESNSSRSSYAGTGVYKSTDGGKSWQQTGLEETHHIGKVIVHPTNPDVVWVAAIGHLYSPNPERGVYQTTDGGKSWQKTLFINDQTGVIDLAIDPQNPQVLYAAAWERHREAWDFKGSGKGSGIYKTTDGGTNWARLTTDGSGFPTTAGVGRIGLAVFPGNPNTVYAILDNQDNREREKPADPGRAVPPPSGFRAMTAEAFQAMPDDQVQAYLDRYGLAGKYTVKGIKADVKNGKYPVSALADFVNANDDLFDIEVKGAEMYRSDDAGKTWRKTHEKYIDNLVFTYGYYFSQVRVSPQDPNKIYTLGVPAIKSADGGKTWQAMNSDNAHSDHHSLWLNPKRPGHLILGNDGGINISYDDGDTWLKMNGLAVGQFYSVNLDMATPYHIYGGLQDNGVWHGPSTYQHTYDWHDSGQYPYKSIMGGDGMQVEIDTRDNNTVYTGFQFGNYFRINKATGQNKPITPRHELGETPYRWNWETPIHLSRHNQDVLYMGSHRFHRSLDRGETFQTLSGDLTNGGKKGNVPYGSLTTLEESPKRFGLLYTGSDDGLIHVSKDGGYTWEKIIDGLPANFWVTQVEPSNHVEARVYASLNGYRYDHFAAMVYSSDDYGKTWRPIGQNLPAEPVNVVKEDPANANILYVGTDNGLYISFDRGANFMAMSPTLPAVAVHDLAIHPRDKDLVVATHGRSFYVADVEHIQQLTPEVLDKPLHVFAPASLNHSPAWGRSFSQWRTPNTPKTDVVFYLNHTNKSFVTSLRVLSAEGTLLRTLQDSSEVGLNLVAYDLTVDATAVEAYQKELTAQAKKEVKVTAADNGKFYLQPGTYTLEVSVGGSTEKQTLKLEPPRAGAGGRRGGLPGPERD